MAKPNWPNLMPLVQRASAEMIEQLFEAGEGGRKALNPMMHIAGVANNLSFMIAYGQSVSDMGGITFVEKFSKAAQQVTL